MRTAVAALLLCLAARASAIDLAGTVQSVADGDTLKLRDEQGVQHRIRLSGIDAPERGQPFSQVSRRSLDELTRGRQIIATCPKSDRYGRKVCTVRAEGDDLGLEQLARGLAWHFKRYQAEQPAAERAAYAAAEEQARLDRRGLWSSSTPQAPWDWRAQRAAAVGR
jgi:endonuclease YncB( thermonuclease family)